MIKRFFEIKLQHHERVDALVSLMLVSCMEVRELQTAFQHMTKFNQVTVALQRQGITSLQVREIFDHVLEDQYPDFKKYLTMNSHTVHDKLFEFVVMNKIMKDDELNDEESNTNVSKFRKAYAAPATAMSDDYSEE